MAARTLARDRRFVGVLGTKPRDDEMDAYLDEGYIRVYDWPPPAKALRPNDAGEVRVVLWPKITTPEQIIGHRPVYARFLRSALADGGWTIVADEGLWLSARDGLNLGPQLSAVAYTGRSSHVTLLMLMQRPRGVPVHCWTNASHAFLWKVANTNDMRELASLGTYPPPDVVLALQQGFASEHEFLYLPCRATGAGSGWAVSQVQIGAPLRIVAPTAEAG